MNMKRPNPLPAASALPLAVLLSLVTSSSVASAQLPVPARASMQAPAPSSLADAGLQEAPVALRESKSWMPPRNIVARAVRPDMAAWLQGFAPKAKITVVATPAEALPLMAQADVLLGFCTRELLDAGKRLRWVQSFSAGVEDCVSAPAVQDGRVLLTNAQRISGPVMSEYVLGVLVALSRGLPQAMANQRESRWSQSYWESGKARMLRGKTMLIVGLGGIGTDVARLANAFGMKVIATRNSSRDAPPFVSHVGLAAELPALVAQADVIVNTAPLTPATTGLFNAALFALMEPTAYFINVGRGASVVTADLDAALRNGVIAGAALDVTEPEPLPPANPLWQAPNIIITPHVSNVSDAGFGSRLALLEENLRRYVEGGKMLSVVQPGRGY